MENQIITSADTPSISFHEVVEAMEQVRAGFTISRMTLGACTLLYALKRKGEKWAKKFSKVQKEYHDFLVETYKEFEEEADKMAPKEEEKVEE